MFQEAIETSNEASCLWLRIDTTPGHGSITAEMTVA